MAHRRNTKYFSRKYNARKALLRGLMVSLVEHGRIKTTVEKAKELRRHIEPAITLGKKNDLATRRLLLSRIPNETIVEKILADVSPRMNTRPGGYTRIIKIGRRPGDSAEMAFIEFVDYDFKAVATPVLKDAKTTKAKKAKAGTAAAQETKVVTAADKEAAGKRAGVIAAAAKRKNIRKIQGKSRVASRA